MAHKKGVGSTGTRDHQNKKQGGSNLGVKKFDGEEVKKGTILMRQRGTKYHPGWNVKCARNYNLYAVKNGIVMFGSRHGKKTINILPKGVEIKYG